MIEAWNNCPISRVLKDERVKQHTIGICKGSCNRMIKIGNTQYNLCFTCADKYRYYGESCDVPNCESIADGSIKFKPNENKIVCGRCYDTWQNMKFCIWERFVEERHLFLLRPPTFVKALAAGLVSLVEHPVKNKEIAECKKCRREKQIYNTYYQICGTCCFKLQYYDEKCSIGGTEPCPNDAESFDTQESRFICNSCAKLKSAHNISSYAMYETQIRTKNNCMICAISVSHNRVDGKDKCSAYIDHDHNTGKTRGVLCHHCNIVEGQINKMPIDATTYAKNLLIYLNHSPLSESWMQN